MWVVSVGKPASHHLAREADVVPPRARAVRRRILHPKERDASDEDIHVSNLAIVEAVTGISAYPSWHWALQ